MQYYELKLKKHHFTVTPHELSLILEGFHHVIVNTGVDADYRESDPEVFLSAYSKLYNKLKSGEKLVFKKDFDIIQPTVGITGHLENCIYEPHVRQCIPKFAEPCPIIDTFCFYPWKDQLSTSFAVISAPENICGLCLSFPDKVEYEKATDKHSAGIVPTTGLDDYETYTLLLSRIKSITKPLKPEQNGKLHRTSVRISSEAKKDFENFYFIKESGIKIL